MPKLLNYLEKVDFQDQRFVGTVALRHEEISLPNGSKLALGIDDGHWVLVYQEKAGSRFQVYECDWKTRKIVIDKKQGGEADINHFKNLIEYFFAHAEVDELVTILPPRV